MQPFTRLAQTFGRIFILISIVSGFLGYHPLSAQAANPDAINWLFSVVATDVDNSRPLSLAVDSLGRRHIVYVYADVIHYAVYENRTWNERATIPLGSGFTNNGGYLDIAVDYRNYAHICYTKIDSGGKANLFYALYTTSLSTGNALDIADAGYYCSIDVNEGGYPSIAYFERATTSLKLLKRGRLVWNAAEEVVNVNRNYYNFISLKTASTGYPHVAYCTHTSEVLNECTSLNYSFYDGSSWRHEVVDNTAGTGYYPSLAISPLGTVKISYHLLNSSLRITSRSSTLPVTWNNVAIQTGDVGLYSSLAIDASDVSHIAYYDETNSRGKYAHVTSTTTTIETLESTGAAGTYTSLALDPSGRPQIAYHDIARTNANFMGKQPLSDLIVSGLWRDKLSPKLVASIKNDGADTQVSNFNAQWFVDNVSQTTNTVIAPNLAPDGVVTTEFSLSSWTCSGVSDVMKVCLATSQSEYSEANNCLEKVWVCDTTPPTISGGPTATGITTTGFTITWTTNEAATSEVRYSLLPRISGTSQSVAGTRTSHSVPITGLRANTSYYVSVRSVNTSGLASVSREILVRTAASSSAKPADPTLSWKRTSANYEQYEFSADFSDPSGIEKITFLLDSQPVGSAFTPRKPTAALADGNVSLAGSYSVQMAPATSGITRSSFFGQHQGQVVALMSSGQTYAWPFLFEPARTDMPVEGWFVTPSEGQKYYLNSGTTIPAGTMLGVDVFGAQYEWECTWNQNPGGDADPGSPPVSCGDVAGNLSTVRFYLDGALLGSVTMPDTNHIYHYDVDLSGKPIGSRKLEARLFTTDGQTIVLERTITYTIGQPSLSISRQVTRSNHAFDVTLNVSNSAQATACATLFDISDYFVGFQAATPSGPYTYSPRFFGGHENNLLIQINGGAQICQGQTLTFQYKLLPVLYADMNSAIYRIGHKPVETHYQSGNSGSIYVTFANETTQFNDSAMPGGKTTPQVSAHNAFKRSDYIMITSPGALVLKFNSTRTNAVLATMADLALLKQGILAFWPADGEMETLNGLLQDGAAWASRMHSNFQVRGKGYVLIVGESEIVPSDTTGPFSVWWADSGHENMYVHYSDNTYAHTDGNGAPDLLLGRIIGNTPEALVFAMQTSIQVHNSSGWDRGGVYLGSGIGNQEDVMQDDADTAATNFTNAGWTSVSKHHWEEEAFLRSYDFPYDEFDGYTTGDVDGDGYDEFIVASRSQDKVFMIKGDGSSYISFNLDFEEGDALTAGDYDNDGADEICIGDRGDQIRCYYATGTEELSFDYDFSAYERLAIGDVLSSNPGNEIVMADDNDILRVFNKNGGEIYRIDIGSLGYDFADYDLLAIGNVDTGTQGTDEFIITDRTHDKIVVIAANSGTASKGVVLKEINIDFDYGDGMAVGKVISGDRAQILIGDRNNHIYIYRGYDTNSSLSYSLYNTIYVDWEQYDGIAVRTLPGADNDEIVHFDRGDRIRVVDPYYPLNAINLFKTNSKDKDLIWLEAHGSPGGMSPAQTQNNFPANFGTAHPIVTAFSCLTGNYEGNSDNSLAEKYLASGAGIYFGSTEVSPVDYNSMSSRVFFTDNWLPGISFAQAMRAYKQAHWDDTSLTGFWHLWVNEYNLYGDPKFDIFASTVPDAPSDMAPQVMPANPIVVDLQPVTSHLVGGYDQVEIPGGQTYLVEGEYQIPIYIKTVTYPAGVHIQNVSLTVQSGLTSHVGFNIIKTEATPLSGILPSRQLVPSLAPTAPTGWSPDFPNSFKWSIDEDGDVETLIITIYPFNYDPEALYSEYFNHFEFNVQTITSDITILSAKTDQEVYAMGNPVNLDVIAKNSAQTGADVTISASIYKVGDPSTQYAFELTMLKDLTGKGTATLSWDSTPAGTGYYTLVIELKDNTNQVVDRATTSFTLGAMAATTTSLSATPTLFKPGNLVTVQLDVTSSGSLPLDGTAAVEIHDSNGALVQEFTQAITALQPGQSITFSPTWNSTGATGEHYTILGYARFESQQSTVKIIRISTKTYQYIPVLQR